MDINAQSVAKVQQAIQTKGHDWKAGHNHFSGTKEADTKLYGGCEHPNGDADLDRREVAAEANKSQHKAAPSDAVNWSDYKGHNYIDPVMDQGKCNSCVAFGTTSAVSARARFTKQLPVDSPNGKEFSRLSPAQMFYCIAERTGCNCRRGWNIDDALKTIMFQGVVPEDCFPYTSGDQPCKVSSHCKDKLTKIKGYNTCNTIAEMKSQLKDHGPVITSISLFSDLYTYTQGVYVPSGVGKRLGGHCVAVIGFDDEKLYKAHGKDQKGAWLCKNSWSTRWGEKGFFWIGYGVCGVDSEMWYTEGFSEIYLNK